MMELLGDDEEVWEGADHVDHVDDLDEGVLPLSCSEEIVDGLWVLFEGYSVDDG
jgi:hypothetical protein